MTLRSGSYFLAAGVLRGLCFKFFGRIQFHEFFNILRTKITGTLQKLATLPDEFPAFIEVKAKLFSGAIGHIVFDENEPESPRLVVVVEIA